MILGAVLVALIVVALASRLATTPTPPPPPAPITTTPRLTARGEVRPVAQARVGTLGGGVLSRLVVEPGDFVYEEQEIARVRGTGGIEIVTAPFSGSVTSLRAHLGDTLLPGAMIATVGDLSRLQVETTDLDEFLIARIYRGQPVTLAIDALDRQLPGHVSTVSLEPVTTATGDDHYPVVIDLLEVSADLRPGMRTRITFKE
ncbi:MAG: HlyD family efflux transporter periplasmic adaptor subunit [Chloroflexi bacterium]|nr:HlyD family efflux transporter periplasmic adaptor subunit [Chloroflexota bacterium]